jgi:mannose-6-phosphate isomerase
MSPDATRPHRLGPNKVPVYYAGGERIDSFRGEAGGSGPEDWVGSVTAFPLALLPADAPATTGISPLPDGTLLADAVAADPEAWLGPELARELGEPGLLVKLLDAGERLPVHCHPTREVARAKLDSRFGKNEGWIVLAAEPGAPIWLGFSRPVGDDELRRWIEAQDAEAMLEAMNRIEVARREVYYVPAGLPHSIGPGVTIVELQEPTSFSILAEYRRFGLDDEQATLGLGWDAARACFDRGGYDSGRLTRLTPAPERVRDGFWRLFSDEATPYFQAYRADAADGVALGDAAFRVLVAERGAGVLAWDGGETRVRGGETWVVPYGAGRLRAEGALELILCLPPEL